MVIDEKNVWAVVAALRDVMRNISLDDARRSGHSLNCAMRRVWEQRNR
jgi:hypothetical protein